MACHRRTSCPNWATMLLDASSSLEASSERIKRPISPLNEPHNPNGPNSSQRVQKWRCAQLTSVGRSVGCLWSCACELLSLCLFRALLVANSLGVLVSSLRHRSFALARSLSIYFACFSSMCRLYSQTNRIEVANKKFSSRQLKSIQLHLIPRPLNGVHQDTTNQV